MPAGRRSRDACGSILEFHNQFGRLCDVLGMKALDLFQSPEHLAWVAERRQERDKAVAARASERAAASAAQRLAAEQATADAKAARKQAAIDKAAKKVAKKAAAKAARRKRSQQARKLRRIIYGWRAAHFVVRWSFDRNEQAHLVRWSDRPNWIRRTLHRAKVEVTEKLANKYGSAELVKQDRAFWNMVARALFALYRTVGAGDSPPESLVLERCPWIVKKVLT